MNAQRLRRENRRRTSERRQSDEQSAPTRRNESASTPKRSDTPTLRQEDPPASHCLTREHIQEWRNSTNELKATFPYVDSWPCMYCLNHIDFRYQERCSRFHCEDTECVGKGKLQITCFWDIKAGTKRDED
ncbi:hypothetical protein BKA58DRAFT_311499 [Alternaria rosae]|uniref:uncharacterized protein n=1 Tax=Alternaria rosae TaxID=1187941 RepID=UPI001E8DBB9D|nr:uncharacterized protein BKA58DRAFT_311499 [Alternaria rosae]KAH6875030.1 hypothetical protein BKA58DRAFT_311499 [Alternaria rosae]